MVQQGGWREEGVAWCGWCGWVGGSEPPDALVYSPQLLRCVCMTNGLVAPRMYTRPSSTTLLTTAPLSPSLIHDILQPFANAVAMLVQPTYEQRAAAMEEVLRWFMVFIPAARARPVDAWCSRPDAGAARRAAAAAAVAEQVRCCLYVITCNACGLAPNHLRGTHAITLPWCK